MKNVIDKLAGLFLLTLLLLISTKSVSAYEIPDFPACSNPGGTLRVSHNSGTHGIVGSSASYTGSDAVYDIGSGNLIQCFCSVDGEGIQTNWWRVNSLNQSEIDTLVNLGWFFVPDGSAWGLESTHYLAKNSNYDCGGSTTVTSTSPVGGQVLGFAATGGAMFVVSLFGFGIVLLVLGILLRKTFLSQEPQLSE